MKRLLLLIVLCAAMFPSPARAQTGPFFHDIPAGCQVRPDSPNSAAGPLYDLRGFYMGYYQPLPTQGPSYTQTFGTASPSYTAALSTTSTFNNSGYSNYGNYGYSTGNYSNSNYGNIYGGTTYGRTYAPRAYATRAVTPCYSRGTSQMSRSTSFTSCRSSSFSSGRSSSVSHGSFSRSGGSCGGRRR